MDAGVERRSQANQTTAVNTTAAMSSDQSTRGMSGIDTKSPHDPLEQYSNLPDDLPTADRFHESMAPFQTDKSNLESLPDELLLLTVEALAPTGSVIKYTKDYQASRANLHSLCLVSKRMDVFARPVLYKDLRLYSYERAARLSATLLTYPTLTSYVKSILFSPPQPRRDSRDKPEHIIRHVDLRPLRFLQDPDIAYWTRSGTEDKARMSQCTMEELIYNLVFKVLSRTPALEALYLKLHHDGGRPIPACLRGLGADAEFMQQVDLQRRLLVDFCEGSSRPNLPNLKTVGVLGTERSLSGYRIFVELFRSFFRSPNLQEVHWAQLDHATHGPADLWVAPFEADWYLTMSYPSSYDSELTPITLSLICFGLNYNIKSTDQDYLTMSRSVTRIKLLAVDITSDDILALTKAFPCLESLTVKDECKESVYHLWCRRNGSLIFQHLGILDNFHTLEIDLPREAVAVDFMTGSGPSKIVSLSAMSKLHALLVPVDFFVGFTTDEPARIQRITTLLPDSLRCLTLLLNDQCDWALMEECRTNLSVKCVVGEFVRDEVAPALLIEFPHLEKIDLCYHMSHYHRNKVHTLAARSLSDTTGGVEAS